MTVIVRVPMGALRVALTVIVELPFAAIGFWLKLTLTPPPVPDALSETDELKPLVGAEVMSVEAEEFRATEKLEGEADRLKLPVCAAAVMVS